MTIEIYEELLENNQMEIVTESWNKHFIEEN